MCSCYCCCLHCSGSWHLHWPFLPWSAPISQASDACSVQLWLLVCALQWPLASSLTIRALVYAQSQAFDACSVQSLLLVSALQCLLASSGAILALVYAWPQAFDACSVQLWLLLPALQWLLAQYELLQVLYALLAYPDRFRNRCGYWFIDTISALMCLVKGQSGVPDMDAITLIIHLIMCQLRCSTYFEYF